MANTLLDVIRKNMQSAPQQLAPQAGATQAAARLQQARGGKQVAPAEGPQMSTVGEQIAIGQAQAGLQDVQQQGAIQAEQLAQRQAEQGQREDIASAQISQQRDITKRKAAEQERQLIGEFERAQEGMSEERRQAKLEQIGFIAALQDDEYLHNLQMEGAKRRLNNDAEFRVALQEQYFAGLEDILREDLRFKNIADMDQRQWEVEMSKMSLDTALKLALETIDKEKDQAFWQGIQGLAKSGLKGYVDYKKAEKSGDLDVLYEW